VLARTVAAAVAAALTLTAAGCGPAVLDEKKTFTLEVTEAERYFDLNAQPAEQTLTVEFSSTASEVDVYVVKGSEVEAFMKAGPSARPGKAMASKTAVKSDKLVTQVPPNTPVRVVFELSPKPDRKKTEVTARLTNKK